MRNPTLLGLTSIVLAGTMMNAEAITIAHGGNSVDIEFVDIGYAGNTGKTISDGIGPDYTIGGVDYEYSIGKYEITADQWKDVAGFDALVENNSRRPDPWSGSQPTARASWYEAAKFANWLTSGNARQGAYQFSDSDNFTGIDRATALATYGVIYVLPNQDEWYKAAYFKSDGSGYTTYTTGDSVPAGGIDNNYRVPQDNIFPNGPWNVGSGTEENNGTYDMGGNVSEWSEGLSLGRAIYFETNFQNPYYGSDVYDWRYPDDESEFIGFRVASITAVPEPTSTALLALGGLAVMMRRRR